MPTTLRLAMTTDAAALQAIYAPYCATPISFEIEPPSVEAMRGRVEKILVGYPWLICEHGGEAIGYAYASPHRERPAYCWSVDVTVYVRQGRQRGGTGRALYTSLFNLLPLQGYITAFAGITIPNPASVGLHEAMGFAQVGVYGKVGFKCGAWHDVAWYQRTLQLAPELPIPPQLLREVCDSEAWHAALGSGMLLLKNLDP